MNKWVVSITVEDRYEFNVEANDADHAIEVAQEYDLVSGILRDSNTVDVSVRLKEGV